MIEPRLIRMQIPPGRRAWDKVRLGMTPRELYLAGVSLDAGYKGVKRGWLVFDQDMSMTYTGMRCWMRGQEPTPRTPAKAKRRLPALEHARSQAKPRPRFTNLDQSILEASRERGQARNRKHTFARVSGADCVTCGERFQSEGPDHRTCEACRAKHCALPPLGW